MNIFVLDENIEKGEKVDISEIKELDVNTDTMWYGFSFGFDTERDKVRMLKKMFPKKDGSFECKLLIGSGDDDIYLKLTYAQVMEIDPVTKPCIISSTEW
jgi:hypothetical protein